MDHTIEMLDRLQHRIAVDGLAAHEEGLARLADLLVRRGILPTVAGILADSSLPDVFRERAFARAAGALRASASIPRRVA